MTINLKAPELRELKPRIIVCGVGGGGCNAVNNMIASGLSGVDFLVANTDAQALASARAERIIQMGLQVTEGLGAGAQPEVGRAAAEEARDEIREHLTNAHMCFVTAGMGGGTGTGAAPVIAMIAREMGILTVGVVTKPFHFEGQRRQRIAESGIGELQKCVDTLIVIPNQNLFRIATEKTTFADAFAMADQVLYSGVASVTDLMVKEGLINLDFADVRSIMRGMGKAMMGTGEATGERRAILSAEAAIANPLLDEVSMKGARGLLISITGGNDLTLYEVDEAASRIRQEVDEEANIILGATFDSSLEGVIRVSVVATGIDPDAITVQDSGLAEARLSEEAVERLRAQIATQQSRPKPVLVVELGSRAGPGRRSQLFRSRGAGGFGRAALSVRRSGGARLIMRSRNIRSRNIRSPRAIGRRMSAQLMASISNRPRAVPPTPSRRAASPTRTGRPEGLPPRKTSGSPVPMCRRLPNSRRARPACRRSRISRGLARTNCVRRAARSARPISAASRSSSVSPHSGPAARKTRYSRSRRSRSLNRSRSANTRRSRSSPRPRTPNTPSVPPPAARPKRRSPASISTAAAPCRSAASRRIIWKSRPSCGVRAITNFDRRDKLKGPLARAFLFWRRAAIAERAAAMPWRYNLAAPYVRIRSLRSDI